MSSGSLDAGASNCNIKVAVRARPLIRSELYNGHQSTRLYVDDEINEVQ